MGNMEKEIDTNTQLPDELSKLIADAIKKVFQEDMDSEVEYGPKIDPIDINNAYRIWYKWFRNATETGTLPNPIPYSLTKELEEVWEKAMDNLGTAGDLIEDAINQAGSFSILGLFLALAAAIAAAVLAALALIDAVLGSLATLSTATIRATACLIYEQLFNAFQTFRLGVSLNGLAFPMMEHLNEPRFNQFKNTSFTDSTGANASSLLPFLPRLKFDLPSSNPLEEAFNRIFHRERHLIYPVSSGEVNPILAAPETYFDKTSLFYAFGDIPLNSTFVDAVINLSNTPAISNEGDLQNLLKDPKNRLGNAMNLTEEFYNRWKINKKLPDFNLDGDRGYAFPCWSHNKGGTVDKPDFPTPIVVKGIPSNTPTPPQVVLEFIP
jgi:hypothetical protein